MDKEGIYRLLDERGTTYEKYEHEPVYTVEQALRAGMPFAEHGLKNLFLKDRKRHYCMVCMRGEKRLDMKALQRRTGIKGLHFAAEDELMAVTGLKPGHVTPFGILNSREGELSLLFDRELRGTRVGVHPMSNDATVFLMFDDLLTLLREERPDSEILCLSL